jgi:hypothetical protein
LPFHGGKGEYLHRFLTRPTFLLLLMGCLTNSMSAWLSVPVKICLLHLLTLRQRSTWRLTQWRYSHNLPGNNDDLPRPLAMTNHLRHDITKRLAPYWHDHTTYSCPQIMVPPPKPDRAQKSLAKLFYLICFHHRLSTQSRRTLRTTRACCWPFTLSHCRG